MKVQNNKTNIYTLSCPITKEIRYIGKTSQSLRIRLNLHLCKCEKEKNHKSSWIKHLKLKGLRPEIELLEVCDTQDWENCEKYWIAMFKFWGFNLTNATDGGISVSGYKWTQKRKSDFSYKHSEETRKKMSNSHKGIKKSKKHKESLSKAKIGTHRTQQTKDKISQSLSGKSKTKSHSAKVGAKVSKPILRIFLDNTRIIYKSLTEASKLTEIQISTISCFLNGKRKPKDGSVWTKI